MEYISGNIFIRPNPSMLRGQDMQGHTHNFDHTTFFQAGWHLVRRIFPDGTQAITQHCSLEYRATRALQEKYEPASVTRPVRGPDRLDRDGRPCFNIKFIEQHESVPDGYVEVKFEPLGYFVLTEASVMHELIALSDNAEFNCVFAHRTPQGDVVQEHTGYEAAYA